MTIKTSDSFNRTDSTTTLGSTNGSGTIDPIAWIIDSGTWGISTNRAYTPTAAANAVAHFDLGTADQEVGITYISGSVNAGLVFRYVDSLNYWKLVQTPGTAVLYRVVGGFQTQVGIGASSGANGDVLSVRCSGNDIICFRNDTPIIGITDIPQLVSDSGSNHLPLTIAAPTTGVTWGATGPFGSGTNRSVEITRPNSMPPNNQFLGESPHSTLFSNAQWSFDGWFMFTGSGTLGVGNSSFFGYEYTVNGARLAVYLRDPLGPPTTISDFTNSTGRTSTTLTFTPNVWHHVAFVFNGTNTLMYVDGTSVITWGASTAAGAADWINIGGMFGVGNGWLGRLAAQAVYPVALSATQVSNHVAANATSATYKTAVLADSPVALWMLDDSVLTQVNGTHAGMIISNSTTTFLDDFWARPYASLPQFSDTFNRADNATVLGVTDGANNSDQQPWRILGSAGITSNQVSISVASQTLMILPMNTSNHQVQVTVPVWTSAPAGLVFRYSSVSNGTYWRLTLDNTGSIILSRVQNFGASAIATVTGGAQGDVLKVIATSNRIRCYRNGTLIMSIADATYSMQCGVGMINNGNTAIRLDDFNAVGVPFDGTGDAVSASLNVVDTGGVLATGGLVQNSVLDRVWTGSTGTAPTLYLPSFPQLDQDATTYPDAF